MADMIASTATVTISSIKVNPRGRITDIQTLPCVDPHSIGNNAAESNQAQISGVLAR